jgi:signal transduction histidine kinase
MAEAIRRTAGDPALIGDVPILAMRLQANAVSLNDLVTNVLDIAAIDSGRVSVEETEFSLNELLNEQCARLLPLAQAKGLKLAVEVSVQPIYLRTDRTKLMRVLTNLLSNAIKFTEGGEVRVTGSLTSHGIAEICVRDTGVGIAVEDVGRIFEEFARVGSAGSEPKRGWGLGLAISRRLVEVMGGKIAVDSQPNVGSAFTIRLPLQSRSVEQQPPALRHS